MGSSKNKKANQNYSARLADGRKVSVKNGVKTYSGSVTNTAKIGDIVNGKKVGSLVGGRAYASNKDTPGYYDEGTGKNVKTSAGRDIYGNSVSAKTIGTESPVIPSKPVPTDVGDMLGMNNASVLQEGFTLQGGQFVKDPNASDVMNATKEANMNMGNIANQMLGYLQPQQDQMKNAYEDTYGISERQAGRDMRRAEQEVQRYTSQLNNITASRDASILALEDTGRGQTTGFIGGEQGRIQRQAAIAALPVQAQLAAAQGNLEIAKSHVDSLFQMKVKDIETEQAYKNTVANTWMSVANQQQSNLLSAAIADSNARAEAKKTAMNDAKQIAMQAIEYGQSSLAASVMKLDPTSATYQQDVMNAMGKLRKPVASTSTGSDWELKDVNGVTSWVNKYTQEIKPAGDSPTGAPDAVQKSLDQLSFLRNTAKDAIANASDRGIFRTPVGPSLITQGIGSVFVGNTSFKQLQNQTDTLKTNVLSLMTDPNVKKFFGPQMSNADVRLMSSTGSTLNPAEQEPEDYIKEVQRLDALFNRMQTAVQQGLAGQVTRSSNVITAPDGLLIEIID